MEANPSKFPFMLMKYFTSTKVILAYKYISDDHIKFEEDIKVLDITIDDKLKFHKQVNILCKNAASQINVL